MRIHKNFAGGNIVVKSIEGDTVYLENELRDTTEDWFYWAFCVEGAESKTLTFKMQPNRLGYFGPAVSHDYENWHWLDSLEGDSFTSLRWARLRRWATASPITLVRMRARCTLPTICSIAPKGFLILQKPKALWWIHYAQAARGALPLV